MSQRSLNRVELIGFVGCEPEVREFGENRKLVAFTLATNDRWRDRKGKWIEKVEWHRAVAFGKLGQICETYIHKGMRVYVEGRLQSRQWEDKSGIKRSITEVIVGDVLFLDNKGRKNGGPKPEEPEQASDSKEEEEEYYPPQDGELPF